MQRLLTSNTALKNKRSTDNDINRPLISIIVYFCSASQASACACISEITLSIPAAFSSSLKMCIRDRASAAAPPTPAPIFAPKARCAGVKHAFHTGCVPLSVFFAQQTTGKFLILNLISIIIPPYASNVSGFFAHDNELYSIWFNYLSKYTFFPCNYYAAGYSITWQFTVSEWDHL